MSRVDASYHLVHGSHYFKLTVFSASPSWCYLLTFLFVVQGGGFFGLVSMPFYIFFCFSFVLFLRGPAALNFMLSISLVIVIFCVYFVFSSGVSLLPLACCLCLSCLVLFACLLFRWLEASLPRLILFFLHAPMHQCTLPALNPYTQATLYMGNDPLGHKFCMTKRISSSSLLTFRVKIIFCREIFPNIVMLHQSNATDFCLRSPQSSASLGAPVYQEIKKWIDGDNSFLPLLPLCNNLDNSPWSTRLRCQ